MNRLLITTAMAELAAGVALLCWPSSTVALLLGSPLDAFAAVVLGRLTGAALLALSIACWLAHYDVQSCAARGVVTAMTVYNLGAVVVLGVAGLRSPSVGIALWSAVALHTAMTGWCITSLLKKPAGPIR